MMQTGRVLAYRTPAAQSPNVLKVLLPLQMELESALMLLYTGMQQALLKVPSVRPAAFSVIEC